jgi:hypothetical protein
LLARDKTKTEILRGITSIKKGKRRQSLSEQSRGMRKVELFDLQGRGRGFLHVHIAISIAYYDGRDLIIVES